MQQEYSRSQLTAILDILLLARKLKPLKCVAPSVAVLAVNRTNYVAVSSEKKIQWWQEEHPPNSRRPQSKTHQNSYYYKLYFFAYPLRADLNASIGGVTNPAPIIPTPGSL